MGIATKIVEVSKKLTKLHQEAGLDVEVMAGLDHVAVFSSSKASAQASANSIATTLAGKVKNLGRVELSFDVDCEWVARVAVEW